MVNRISWQKKVKRNLGTSNRRPHIVFWRSSKGRLRPSFMERLWEVNLGRPHIVRLGRPQDVRSGHPCDDQISSLGDVLGKLQGEVLGTSWGPTFAGWDNLENNQLCNYVLEQLQFFKCYHISICPVVCFGNIYMFYRSIFFRGLIASYNIVLYRQLWA